MITEMLPKNKFWVSNFPNMDSGKDGYVIPEFYGEKNGIEPVCIDTTIMKYQIAHHEIKAIDTVQVDGVDLAEDENYETDLANAQFTIYGMPYCAGNQSYIIVLQGDFGINGTDYVEVGGDSGAGYGDGQYYKIDGAGNWVGTGKRL